MHDGERAGAQVDRRAFSTASAAAVAGVGVGVIADAARASEEPGVCGRTVSYGSGRLDLVLAEGGERLRVDVPPGAEILRDGPARLRDFDVGERVVVQGASEAAGVMVATAVHVVYDVLDATVIERRGNVLRTDVGDVVLDGRSESRGRYMANPPITAEPLDEIGNGDHLSVLARRDPRGNRLLGRLVGVRGTRR